MHLSLSLSRRWSSLFPPMPAAMEATDTDFDEEGDAGAEEGAVMDEDVAVGNVPVSGVGVGQSMGALRTWIRLWMRR